MFQALFSGVLGSVAAAGITTPVLRISGYTETPSTTWASPAINAGELVVACRLSSGGGVQGMGTDFTFFNDSSAITAAIDVNFGWRIAGSSGSPTHTIPDNGSPVIYAVFQAGTFHPTVPLTAWAVLQYPANADVPLAVRTITGGVGIYGSGASASGGARIGTISGATQLALKSDGQPYSREFYRPAGWAAQNVALDPGGTTGQNLTVWAFSIQGKP